MAKRKYYDVNDRIDVFNPELNSVSEEKDGFTKKASEAMEATTKYITTMSGVMEKLEPLADIIVDRLKEEAEKDKQNDEEKAELKKASEAVSKLEEYENELSSYKRRIEKFCVDTYVSDIMHIIHDQSPDFTDMKVTQVINELVEKVKFSSEAFDPFVRVRQSELDKLKQSAQKYSFEELLKLLQESTAVNPEG